MDALVSTAGYLSPQTNIRMLNVRELPGRHAYEPDCRAMQPFTDACHVTDAMSAACWSYAHCDPESPLPICQAMTVIALRVWPHRRMIS